jgi:hypothetical protein
LTSTPLANHARASKPYDRLTSGGRRKPQSLHSRHDGRHLYRSPALAQNLLRSHQQRKPKGQHNATTKTPFPTIKSTKRNPATANKATWMHSAYSGASSAAYENCVCGNNCAKSDQSEHCCSSVNHSVVIPATPTTATSAETSPDTSYTACCAESSEKEEALSRFSVFEEI